MKIKIEVDCTPGEARAFCGLPDLGELQKAAADALMEHMQASVGALDPESLMKTWFSGDMGGWQQMQKNLWTAASGGKPEKDDS